MPAAKSKVAAKPIAKKLIKHGKPPLKAVKAQPAKAKAKTAPPAKPARPSKPTGSKSKTGPPNKAPRKRKSPRKSQRAEGKAAQGRLHPRRRSRQEKARPPA